MPFGSRPRPPRPLPEQATPMRQLAIQPSLDPVEHSSPMPACPRALGRSRDALAGSECRLAVAGPGARKMPGPAFVSCVRDELCSRLLVVPSLGNDRGRRPLLTAEDLTGRNCGSGAGLESPAGLLSVRTDTAYQVVRKGDGANSAHSAEATLGTEGRSRSSVYGFSGPASTAHPGYPHVLGGADAPAAAPPRYPWENCPDGPSVHSYVGRRLRLRLSSPSLCLFGLRPARLRT
jgi:hypothetical protein